jgi:hypothetical protein
MILRHRLWWIFAIFTILVGCGGGGGGSSGGVSGTVIFPALRSNSIPSGANSISVAADANQWARIANTGDSINQLVYGTGLVNFNAYIQSFDNFVVGTTNGLPGVCPGGSGTSAARIVKASNRDLSLGDGIEITYTNCLSNGITFSGKVGAFVSGLNIGASTFAVTYTAQNFGTAGNNPSVTYSGINSTLVNSFDANPNSAWLSYYYGSQTQGTYAGPAGQANFENGSYNLNNIVSRQSSSGNRQFVSDVSSGVFNLKLDTDNFAFILSNRITGTVYVVRNTFLSKVRVNLQPGGLDVSLDAANDGFYEATTQYTGVSMF